MRINSESTVQFLCVELAGLPFLSFFICVVFFLYLFNNLDADFGEKNLSWIKTKYFKMSY